MVLGGPKRYALNMVFKWCLAPSKPLKYNFPNIIKLVPVGGHGLFKLAHREEMLDGSR